MPSGYAILCSDPRNTNRTGMTGNAVAQQIVDVAYLAHKVLGPGLLESMYQAGHGERGGL